MIFVGFVFTFAAVAAGEFMDVYHSVGHHFLQGSVQKPGFFRTAFDVVLIVEQQ